MSNRICPTCHGSGCETRRVSHPMQNVYGWNFVERNIYERECMRCAGTGTLGPVTVSVPRVQRSTTT